MPSRFRLIIALATTAGAMVLGAAISPGATMTRDGRPNILLIVADDLGYADLGAFGGDIDTPNIDSLARRGIRFTQFHASPYCATTRAMLLSGNNNHVAGVASQSQVGILDFPVRGYEGGLSERIAPLPRLLGDAGYHTYIAGKWHLGHDKAYGPRAAGFSRAFTMLDGAGTHFDDRGYKEGGSSYRADDDPVEYPEGRYSTELYTDKLIEFIEANRDDGRPFFAFAAYTSPHWPLQVPDEYLDLYSGRYDDGYDDLRERRFASLKRARIIPQWSRLPPRNEAITPWADLDAEARRREARKMELYAAMVDNLDDHVGRLLAYLENNGLLENTLIVFMSDNGAAGEDFMNAGPFTDYIQGEFDNSYAKMGTAESFVSYGPQWAEAGSAPFQRYKSFTREGGLVAPLIVAGPGVALEDAISDAYLTVMDLAPTFLEVAQADYPEDGAVQPLLGTSLQEVLTGEATRVHDDDYATVFFHRGRAFLRRGDWKLVTLDPPFDEDAFELFNLAEDPGETIDLAAERPDIYQELLSLWREERVRLGIILPEDL